MVDEKDRDPWTSRPGRAASRLGALLSITSAGCVVLDKTDDGSTCNSCPGTSSDPSSRTDTADTSDTGDTGDTRSTGIGDTSDTGLGTGDTGGGSASGARLGQLPKPTTR